MRFSSFISVYAVLLILGGPCRILAASGPMIEFIGEFSNMRHTREHTYGYAVQLWRAGDEVIGLLSSSDGLSGDAPTGQLEDVHYDAGTGWLSFSSKLSVGLVSRENGKWAPTRDLFTFKGRLEDGKLLTGRLSHLDLLMPRRAPTIEQIRLVKTGTRSAIQARTLPEWNRETERILKFRGPKW